jgi:serine/threonine-protein kinase
MASPSSKRPAKKPGRRGTKGSTSRPGETKTASGTSGRAKATRSTGTSKRRAAKKPPKPSKRRATKAAAALSHQTTSQLNGQSPFPDRYDLLQPLGEGGLATVYKIRDRRDGAIRALKALKPEQAKTPRDIERLENEFRILHRLHHPSLPQMFDYGTTRDGTRYMVMEYLEGEPLDAYVAGHKEDLWFLLYQITEALAFIHEHQLLHLDLKPGNLLVRRTKAFGGKAKPLVMLIDFGLSYQRDVGGRVLLTGSPGYMPPEVIRGEEHPTRAADYYSLGVSIYELIEGRLPFEGSMDDVLRAHLTKPVTFDTKKAEYMELYEWIEQLMEKDPMKRLEAFENFRRSAAARVRILLGKRTPGRHSRPGSIT